MISSVLWFALLLATAWSDGTLPAERSVKGTAINCPVQDGVKEQDEVEWQFPHIVLSDKTASVAVNAAIEGDVRKALRIDSFTSAGACKEVDEELRFGFTDYCKLTYASRQYVSLQCQTAGRQIGGREDSTNRTLLLRIRGPKVTRIGARSLFKDRAAFTRVARILAEFIRSEVPDESHTGDDEILALARKMGESATLQPKGIHFVVLGPGRTAFKTTLDCKAVGKQLAGEIRREIGCEATR